jgi:hypothetical protein
MLRSHFLIVGHCDCTIISHPSGRLTTIDINNLQDYDETKGGGKAFMALLRVD